MQVNEKNDYGTACERKPFNSKHLRQKNAAFRNSGYARYSKTTLSGGLHSRGLAAAAVVCFRCAATVNYCIVSRFLGRLTECQVNDAHPATGRNASTAL
jgi:hypothetical protein